MRVVELIGCSHKKLQDDKIIYKNIIKMAKISAADVATLRKQTGAGMMDCKKALTESDGDFDKAIEYLRKKGQKVANKRADRDANEGIVVSKVSDDNKFGLLFMLNCETDFVGKNEDFINYANRLADVALANKAESVEAIKELEIDGLRVADSLADMIGKIGEKLEIGAYEFITAEYVSAYTHNGSRLATIVGFNKAESENLATIGKDVAMQVASMNPVALNSESVPSEIIEKETEIAKDLLRQEGKPEAMIDKIVVGKINKYFKENTLMSMAFIKDNKTSVAAYVQANDKELDVTDFKRAMLGE